MALAMRGFILGAPKPNSVQMPNCMSCQQKSMTMLQTPHYGLQNSRKISRSLITCAKKPGTGSGPKINQTTSSEQPSVSNGSSSKSEKATGKESKGSSSEANAAAKQSN